MDTQLRLDLAIELYNARISQLDERGIEINPIPLDRLKSLSLNDLNELNRKLQELLRNPTQR